MSEKRVKKTKTVGNEAYDRLLKTPESTDPIELEREMHKDYESNINQCINSNLKEYSGDFYVVVTTKKERLMQNVLRNYFFGRKSCPTPEYDQTVYKYDRSSGMVEFLWVLPSKDTCEMMRDNALKIVPEERMLRDFVLDFYDGTLFKLSKRLNGEESDSPLLAEKSKTFIKGI